MTGSQLSAVKMAIASKEWDAEIDSLAGMITEAANFDINEFDNENATDADIDTIGRLLKHA